MDEVYQKYLDAKFDHLEGLLTKQNEEEIACRKEVFNRLRELEKARPFNPAWIYGLGISLIAGIEMFRLLHWLK